VVPNQQTTIGNVMQTHDSEQLEPINPYRSFSTRLFNFCPFN